ncbi:nucleotidyltransferase [Candidatus Pacearchaeota archaeon]|nr:nucleotidyltransferase [Candidatus Pacearchaeota archaeon]|tara:strand:- start:391 stop:1149 length:759 start_codon:yes stop_codon:yes gene_type:complete
MKAIILCAGKGERLRPLTNNLPKPMLDLGGTPLLEYNLQLCKNHGIKEIALNTSYLPQKIRQYFGDGEKLGISLDYSFEPELLGTSGALNNFKEFFDEEDFIVIYGDNLTDINLGSMLKEHRKQDNIATIFLQKEELPTDKTTPGFLIVDENLIIKEIVETPTEEQLERYENIPETLKYNNSGIYVLNKRIFDYIPPGFSDFAKDIFPKILDKEKIQGFLTKGFYRELGAIERYKLTDEQIKSGEIKLNLIK